jgi:hypothetical protein
MTSKLKKSNKSKYETGENHIVLYVSAHGAEMLPERRDRLTRSCDFKYGDIDVKHMTFTGYANIATEASTVRNKIKLPSGLSFSTYNNNPTEYAVLSGLVPAIYTRKDDSMDKKFEDLFNDIQQLGEASDIHYSSTSPPTIVENPCMNKRWLFRYLKGENDRNSVFPRPEGARPPSRHLPMRRLGDPLYNAVLTMPGVYILDTNNSEDSHFALYKKMKPEDNDRSQFNNRSHNINQIQRSNIFTTKKYNHYWRRRIDLLDFTSISSQEVFDIDFDITFLFKLLDEICKLVPEVNALYKEIIAIYNQMFASDVIESKRVLNETMKLYKEKLKTVNEVTSRQLIDMQITEEEEEEEEKKQRHAEDEYNIALDVYTQSKNENMRLENDAAIEMCKIIKEKISIIINNLKAQHSHEQLGIIFNIIMKRKLENIIKSAILHGRLSFRQLVILFRGLRYKKIYIVDPSCFTIEQVKHLSTRTVADIDTQTLPNEMEEYAREGSPVSNQSIPNSFLRSINGHPPPPFGVGGTIRNKSRKRRTRKNRHTTRRRRR